MAKRKRYFEKTMGKQFADIAEIVTSDLQVDCITYTAYCYTLSVALYLAERGVKITAKINKCY